MHQIISGEIHKKNKISNKENFKNFFEDQKKIFNKINENCLYQTLDLIKSNSLNYLNFLEKNEEYKILKGIIEHEYIQLEKLYPYLGDLFLLNLFDNKNLNKNFKKKILNKRISKKLINNFDYSINKSLFESLFKNFSLEYFIDINYQKDLEFPILIKNNENYFNLFFENDYYLNQKEKIITNYKIVILDGIIENVSEIHHLLYDSAENKIPYVIFCYGVSPEVKHNIIINNKKEITKVYPISFNFNEESLNILNDIAVLHNSEIITANKGQSIATEIRNLKCVGKKINIQKNYFSFEPICSTFQLESHRKFLNKRIQETKIEDNKNFLIKRYKRLFSKNLKIILSESLKKDSDFNRELNYGINLLSNASNPIVCIKKVGNKKNIYFPLHFLKIVKNKKESLKNLLNDIEKIII